MTQLHEQSLKVATVGSFPLFLQLGFTLACVTLMAPQTKIIASGEIVQLKHSQQFHGDFT